MQARKAPAASSNSTAAAAQSLAPSPRPRRAALGPQCPRAPLRPAHGPQDSGMPVGNVLKRSVIPSGWSKWLK